MYLFCFGGKNLDGKTNLNITGAPVLPQTTLQETVNHLCSYSSPAGQPNRAEYCFVLCFMTQAGKEPFFCQASSCRTDQTNFLNQAQARQAASAGTLCHWEDTAGRTRMLPPSSLSVYL